MSKAHYKKYEILVGQVIEGLAKLEDLKKSIVMHDVQLRGISGADHQIDVLWEFEIGPLKHRIIFQAKDWSSKVTMVALNTFSGVLRDFPDARGVLVTKTGYDKGNIDKIANGYGISLFVLDESGKLAPSLAIERTAKVSQNQIQVRITNWAFPNKEDIVLFEEHLKVVGKENLKFHTLTGKTISFKEINRQIYDLASKKNLCKNEQKITYTPGEPLFVRISGNRELKMIGAKAIIFSSEEILGETSMRITHVLQSVLNDKTYYVDDSLKVHRRERIEMNLQYKDPNDPTKTLTTTFFEINESLNEINQKKS